MHKRSLSPVRQEEWRERVRASWTQGDQHLNERQLDRAQKSIAAAVAGDCSEVSANRDLVRDKPLTGGRTGCAFTDESGPHLPSFSERE